MVSNPFQSLSWSDREFIFTALILIVATTLRGYLAWTDHSILYPDEIFQSLEQGHRLAFGYGIVPWEFRYGARSWIFPGVLGSVMKAASLLGVQTSLGLVSIAKFFMVLLSSLCGLLLVVTARRSAGRSAGVVCGLLFLCFPPFWIYSHRAFSEVAAAPLICGSILLFREPERYKNWLAGALAALTFFVRYQTGIVGLTLLVILVITRRRREAFHLICGAAVVFLCGGILDYLTWGRLFQSLSVYVLTNIQYGLSPTLGTEPASYYAVISWQTFGLALVPLLLTALIAVPRARSLASVLIVFVVVHSLIPHKQYRFIFPVLPLFLTLGAIGIVQLTDRLHGRRMLQGLIVGTVALLMMTHTHGLTHRDIGSHENIASLDASVWWSGSELQYLLAQSGAYEDMCGITILNTRWNWSGGYTYLHRDIPLFFGRYALRNRTANFALVRDWHNNPLPAHYERIQTMGSDALYRRLDRRTCRTPRPGYRLF